MKYFVKRLSKPIPEIYNNPHVDYWDGQDSTELYLCSRDIQVGEKFNSANGWNFVCSDISDTRVYSIGGLHSDVEEVPHDKSYAYKVIGQISPEATWVKERDEFDEKDINHGGWKDEGLTQIICNIKGPCGHFHNNKNK